MTTEKKCGSCGSFDPQHTGQGETYGKCKGHNFLVADYQGSGCDLFHEKGDQPIKKAKPRRSNKKTA